MTDRGQGDPAAGGRGAVTVTADERRTGRRRGRELEYPRRPVLTALSIPPAALLVLAGGALLAFHWMLVPGLALLIGAVVGLIGAVTALSPAPLLRWVVLPLMLAPMLGAALLGMSAARSAVLQARGVARAGVITRITEHHGKTATYTCAVRYDGPGRGAATVSCGAFERVGERVRVVRDPRGWVDPELGGGAGVVRAEVFFAVASDVALMAVCLSAAAVGGVLRWRRIRVRARGSATGTADGPERALP